MKTSEEQRLKAQRASADASARQYAIKLDDWAYFIELHKSGNLTDEELYERTIPEGEGS